MPTARCRNCGRETNSTTSNYWIAKGKARKCYAAVEDGRWVKGCAYGELPEGHQYKKWIDGLLKNKGKESRP